MSFDNKNALRQQHFYDELEKLNHEYAKILADIKITYKVSRVVDLAYINKKHDELSKTAQRMVQILKEIDP